MKIKNVLIGALSLASVPFITGGAGWNVPACDAPAVVESGITLASVQFNRSEKDIKFKNIESVKLRDGKSRTCLAELTDKKTGRYVDDFYYRVLVTNGIKWVVTDLN